MTTTLLWQKKDLVSYFKMCVFGIFGDEGIELNTIEETE